MELYENDQFKWLVKSGIRNQERVGLEEKIEKII